MDPEISEPGRIHGTVASGFESVRERLEHDLQHLAEEQVQLCVYHRGERVVDLWGTTRREAGFSPDSLINVFSSGKSLAAIAIAALVGKGQLRYVDRIAQHWPEFGEHGKGELTVADLMRHEAGLATFDRSIDPDDLHAEKLKKNRVGALIEAQSARFPTQGSRREYHAVTRGWIANELFRRVDPAGRTIGEFLREEISEPLGADASIGVRETELERVTPIKPLGIGFQLLESLRPRALGRRIVHNIFQILGLILRILPSVRHGTTRGAPPPYKGMRGVGFFNDRSVTMGETPSAAAKCSARGLAKIAGMMASRGRFGGRAYVASAGWDAMHAEPSESDMGFTKTVFTQGGVNQFAPAGADATRTERAFNQGREGFYGWMGLGGSIFQWHPEEEIGFAFVPTSLHMLDILNERGKEYQAEVLRCIQRLRA